jgi:ATP phosphoribosyltransferase
MFRAQEIPRYVGDGHFDAGISGQDLVAESGADVTEIATFRYARSGFGKIRLVLAVPNDSAIRSVRDLEGKRIATEDVNLTTRFLKAHGVKADVEFSWGATEAKPPELVDAIVERTETGSSLRANNLRIVAEIMTSVTVLIANRDALRNAWKKSKIDEIAMMLRGALTAESMVGLKMNVPKGGLKRVLAVLPAMKNPTVAPLSDGKWVSVETVIEEREARPLIARLKSAGASGLVEYPLNKVIP